MASTEGKKDTGIQMKHVFIAIIAIVSTMMLIASIVLITIGYLNPFGTVGLGILGGGCVLYFSTLLFFCVTFIWMKNKYYADETDYGEKHVGTSTEDISLLKPASNVTSSAQTEITHVKETDGPLDKNNPVPLYSVSTIYSSVSSTSTIPQEKVMLYNWQGHDDTKGALDSDVFSSSLTAMQHGHMKSQEKLELSQGSTELINCDSTGLKIKDMEKRQIADLSVHLNNGKSVFDISRQRKPLVMDTAEILTSSHSFVPHGNGDKQLVKNLINVQSKTTEENNTSTNTQINGRKNLAGVPGPVEGAPTSTAPSKHHHHMANRPKHVIQGRVTHGLPMSKNGSQEWEPSLEDRSVHIGEKDTQTSDRHGSLIPEGDSSTHNPTKGNRQTFQVVTSKGLCTVPAANAETGKKQKSCEKLELDKLSYDRTAIPLQYLLPKSRLNQTAKVPFSSQVTKAEDPSGEVKVIKKQVKPGTRTNV